MERNRKIIITLIIIIAILIVAIIAGIIYIVISNEKDKSEQIVVNTTNTNNNNINNVNEDDELLEQATAMEIQTFNSQFTPYEGEGLSASQIRALISLVISNNASNEEHLVSVKMLGTEYEDGTMDTTEVSSIMQRLNTNVKYSVDLGYENENGYINEIYIEAEQDLPSTPTSLEVLTFNQNFDSYHERIITGEELNELVQIMKKSNSENPEHQISLFSDDIQSLDDIVATDRYEIIVSYDEEGYASKVQASKQN